MKLTKKAFTLVELIVVITILAILGTIAFISLKGYSASSRDSVRISDVFNMKTSLELFHINAGKYPLPDGYAILDYDSETLWYQGTFGSGVVSQLSRNMNKTPIDPLTKKEYVFSIANNKNEFQILTLLESDMAQFPITPFTKGGVNQQTNAATLSLIPKVDGNYNGVFIKTATYIIPIPSIITAENINVGGITLTNENIKSQITNLGKNIPNIGNINSATGKLNINLSVYSGPTITSTSLDSDKIAAMKAIQGAYTGSELANSDVYKLILNTADNDLPALSETIILDKTSSVTTLADTEAPTGGDFTIPVTTSTESITLTITCPEEDGVGMYISGTGTTSGGNIWEACVSSKNIILTSGDGTKNITMNFRDSVGNITSTISKSTNLTIPRGEQLYTTPGTFNWTAPSGVTSVSVVCVGGGSAGDGLRGGAGGGLGRKNGIIVVPGNSYTVIVGVRGDKASGTTGTSNGGDSYFVNSTTVKGGGGVAFVGGTYVGNGGGNGGNASTNTGYGGGGGAGGYTGKGGAGGVSGQAGAGGGGGGGANGGGSGAGGGVGLLGQGTNGAGGVGSPYKGGFGGSGGGNATSSAGNYGGGSMAASTTNWRTGGGGACRIIWGAGRAFPSTDVGL